MENAKNGKNIEWYLNKIGSVTEICFKGTCHIDNSSEADVELVTDPFLCPFLGSSGPVYLKGNVYGSDPFEAYHTGMWFSYLCSVLFSGETSRSTNCVSS